MSIKKTPNSEPRKSFRRGGGRGGEPVIYAQVLRFDAFLLVQNCLGAQESLLEAEQHIPKLLQMLVWIYVRLLLPEAIQVRHSGPSGPAGSHVAWQGLGFWPTYHNHLRRSHDSFFFFLG